MTNDTIDSSSTKGDVSKPTTDEPEVPFGKKQIKAALNKGGGNKHAAKLRKKRMRNDLRAEAYHPSARTTRGGLPLRLKVLMALTVMTIGMLLYNRFRYTKEHRVDNVWVAAQAGDYESVMRVLNKRPEFVDIADGEGNTLMHYAAISGNVGICKAVMELRGRYSRLNAVRRLPIHYAAEHGSLEVAEILMNRNTLVSLKDSDGLQPIHLAARGGHADMLDLFRRKAPPSMDVNAASTFQMTPLHYAAQAGKAEAVKALLVFNTIKLDPFNSHGQTPLHMAVICGHKDVVEVLVEGGADPHFASDGTRSALDYAREKKDEELIKILSTPQSVKTIDGGEE